MRCVIVPNTLSEAIYAKVDAALADQPDAAPDREFFYRQLLRYYDEHGVIPDFDLKVRVLSEHQRDAAEHSPAKEKS